MFFHNFKYIFKALFKNKALIFWTFAFPLLLGTFFNLAFSDIEKNEKLDIINIAIVDNENFNNDMVLVETFKNLSDENNEEQLFNTKYVDLKTAKKLLEDNEISGYLLIEEHPKIVVNNSSVNETIFKYVTEEIIETKKITETLSSQELKNNPLLSYEQIYQNILTKLQNNNINIEDISSKNLSYTMIEFYTLIAMTCLYGGILGMTAINLNLANMSSKGKRISISPISKSKLILSSVLASYLVQLIGLILLFIYTIFVLKVDYGDHLFYVILLSLIGSLAGLALGILIGSILKTNENHKTGIIIAITMLGSFLSGMMGITMKYIIDKNIPILNKINPANMITDGFYSLYYYGVGSRYFFNIISLLIFSLLLLFIAGISLRRKKYDSI